MMKLFVFVFLQISQADHAEVWEVDEALPSNLDGDVHHLLVRWVQPQAVQGHMQVLAKRVFSMTRAIVNALKTNMTTKNVFTYFEKKFSVAKSKQKNKQTPPNLVFVGGVS